MLNTRDGRRQGLCRRLRIGGFLLALLASVESARAGEVQGAPFEPYLHSTLIEQSAGIVPEYRLALGMMKKVNGVIVPEEFKFIAGELSRYTYRIPDGHRSEDAFRYYQSMLQRIAHTELFQCSGRRCGSSNHWANTQFGIARLYGLEREQHYLAAQIGDGRWLALYAVQRGNKRVFVHLDVISPVSQPEVSAVTDGPRSAKRLFVEVIGGIPTPDDAVVEALRKEMQRSPALKLWLVGYGGQGGVVTSRQQVEAWIDVVATKMITAGVDAARVERLAIGVLGPVQSRDIPSQRVELLLLPD